MRKYQAGFTLIELMIAVGIMGILASIGIATYQNYMIRAQVAEGLQLTVGAKVAVVNSFLNTGEAPSDRAAAGLSPQPTDTTANYVESVAVANGGIVVTFGHLANANIAGMTLTLTPYESPGSDIIWRCGVAPVPAGASLMGSSGGGQSAVYASPTVPVQYLPTVCKS